MTHTIVGYFHSLENAQTAVGELKGTGLTDEELSVMSGVQDDQGVTGRRSLDGSEPDDEEAIGSGKGAVVGGLTGLAVGIGALAIPGVGPILAAGPLAAALTAALGAISGAVIAPMADVLTGAGVPAEDATLYEEGIRRGRTVVTVHCDDYRSAEVEEILNDNGAMDVEDDAQSWGSEIDEVSTTKSSFQTPTADGSALGAGEGMGAMPGQQMSNSGQNSWATANMPASTDISRPAVPTGTETPTSRRPNGFAASDNEINIPVAEEELIVGKREVSGGGVRVYTKVNNVPVRQNVTLRQEKVTVDRRPVDREATNSDFDGLPSQELRMSEMSEEAVVSKRTRIREEVVVSKKVNEASKTVEDTVLRTEVDVKPDRETSQGNEGQARRPH